MNLSRWPSILLLASIAYAPWHGAIFLGRRPKVGIDLPILDQMTWPGLFNVFLIGIAALALAALVIRALKQSTLTLGALAIAMIPAGLAIGRIEKLDHLSLIGIQNFGLLSLLCLLLLQTSHRRLDLTPLKRAPDVLMVSLFFAVIVPQVYAREGADIYWEFFAAKRFAGWTGEGTPLAFSAAILGLWSLAKLLTRSALTKPLIYLGFSLYVIDITLHRGSILALFLGFVFLIAFSAQIRLRSKLALLVSAILVMGAFVFLNPDFREKSNFIFDKRPDNQANYTKRAKATDLDRIINTNGRAEAFERLNFEMDSRTRLLFGNGTGYAPRLLRFINFNSPEPGSDITRVWIEFGILGVVLFLALLAFLTKRLSDSPISIGFLGLLFGYTITENVLVTPSFGYLPILLFALAHAIGRKDDTQVSSNT